MNNYKHGVIVGSVGTFREKVESVYNQLFESDSEYPYLINVRNYIPRILDYEDHMQRYFTFNLVRKHTYFKNGITGNFPTACAVGSTTNDFVVKYIRAKSPASYFSNPNQVNAFEYPSKYGMPLFSRAATHNGNLLVSGTASIVGSDTVHPNNLKLQTRTTLLNLNKLIIKSSLKDPELEYTTYVKNKRDIDEVSDILREVGVESTIINVDICRDDLLVEIEAYSKGLYEKN